MMAPTMRLLRRATLLTTFAFSCAAGHAQGDNADIYGQWKIKDMIGMGAVSSLSEEQARKLIGKPLRISAERFEFNGRVCAYPRYSRTRESPRTYFDREWHTGTEGIPLPNPVTIIETPGCDFMFPIRKDHLMIAEDGIFFEAVRVHAAQSATASRRSDAK